MPFLARQTIGGFDHHRAGCTLIFLPGQGKTPAPHCPSSIQEWQFELSHRES